MARPRARWAWLLADAQGAALAELPTASGLTLTRTRNASHEVQFTLSHHDDAAELLLSALRSTGMPTLRGYRRGPNDPVGTLRFNGHLAPFGEDAEEEATLTPVFRSPFARVQGDGSGRGRFTGDAVTYTVTDSGLIARNLIDAANLEGYTGLATSGVIEPTKLRDRTYRYANVGDAVHRFTEMLDGFDFYEDFVEGGTTLATFNVVARQGQERPSAKFEYGAGTLGNVRSMSREMQPPINVARVLGANGLVGVRTDEPSRVKYGDWPVQVSATDITEQVALDEKAQGMLRGDPIRTVSFVPEYALENCPQPFDDFDLGDTVGFFARRAALWESVRVRVNGMRIVISEDGYEATEIPDPTTPGEEATIRAGLSLEVNPEDG